MMRFVLGLVAMLLGGWLLALLTLGARGWDGPATNHFDGERFQMPGGVTVADKGFFDLLRWQTSREPAAWPAKVAIVPVKPAARVDGNGLSPRWWGMRPCCCRPRA